MDYKKQTLGVYSQWYENNRPAIKSGKWNLIEKDILLHPDKDKLRGLNLLAFLSDKVNTTINDEIVPRLEAVVPPTEWFFPDEARHFTVLDIIPHNSGLVAQEIEKSKSKYTEVISQTIESFDTPIIIGFEGIFASPDGITIQGFPVNSGLPKLRKVLRKELGKAGLANLESKKYVIETAHVALVKFTQNLNGHNLLKTIDSLRNVPLGSFRVNEIILNISSRYDKIDTIEVVKKLDLRN